MIELLSRPWPWYVVGAILGAVAPLLLLLDNRLLRVSGNLRTICAAVTPRDAHSSLASALAGSWTYGDLRPRLPH